MNQGKNQLLGHNWIPDCITSATWMYPCVITPGKEYIYNSTGQFIYNTKINHSKISATYKYINADLSTRYLYTKLLILAFTHLSVKNKLSYCSYRYQQYTN